METVSRTRTVLALSAVPLLAPIAAAQHGGPGPSYPAENFIVIVLDDVGSDKLSSFDWNDAPPYASTPRLNQLANQGIKFRSFYVNPYCSTTRACVQTGRYAYHHGIGGITRTTTTDPGPDEPKLDDSEVFLSELLKDGFPGGGPAFTCGAFGKWHLTYDYVDVNQYTVPLGNETHAIDNGYEYFCGTMSNVAMLDNGDDHYRWRKVTHDPLISLTTPVVVQENRWNPTVIREEAVAWINAQTGPYFAYVAFNPPHAPLQVPPYELVSSGTAAELDALTPGPPQEPPALGDPGHKEPGANAKLYYRAMLESVDREIANLLDGVKQANLAKYQRTMIFVLSDNGTPGGVIHGPPPPQGPHDPDHGKGTVYQIGVRVPLIVSGSPVPIASRGDVCTQLVAAVDLWPTIADITGAVHTATIDGVSFRSLILDTSAPAPRAVAFSQQFAPNVNTDLYPVDYDCFIGHERSITNGEYKYIVRQVVKTSGPLCATPQFDDNPELYHLPTDEEEGTNIYDPLHPAAFYLSQQLDLLVP